MAIHEKYEVAVLVNSKKVHEYAVPEDEQIDEGYPVVRKYIEAQDGLYFKIKLALRRRFEFPTPMEQLSFKVYMDDVYMDGVIVANEKYLKRNGWTETIEGRVNSDDEGWLVEKFRFGELQITEDDTAGDKQTVQLLYEFQGTIEVEVWPFAGELVPDTKFKRAERQNGPVPEKALKGKAVTIATELAPAERGQNIQTWRGTEVGIHPLVSFVFKYRTRKSLEDLMIIDKRRSPSLPAEPDLDTLTGAELRNLVRRQRAELEARDRKPKLEQGQNIKRERVISLDDDDEDDDDEIQVTKKPKQRRVAAEVITIDSD